MTNFNLQKRTKEIIYFLLFFICSYHIFAENTWEYFGHQNNTMLGDNKTFSEDNNKVYISNLTIGSIVGSIDIYDINTKTWTSINGKNTKILMTETLPFYLSFLTRDMIVKNSTIYAACRATFLILSPTDTTVFNKYNSDEIKAIQLGNTEGDIDLVSLAMDSLGTIWAVARLPFETDSAQYHLFKYDENKLHKITVPDTVFHPKNAISFMFDKNGNLWHISSDKAILKYDGNNFKTFDLTKLDNTDIGIKNNEKIGASYYSADEDKIYIFINYNDNTKQQTRLISIKNDEFYNEDLSDIDIPWNKIRINNSYIDKNRNLYLGYVSNPAQKKSSNNFYIVTPDKKVKIIDIPFELTGEDNPYTDHFYDNFFVDSQNYLWVSRPNGGVWRANIDKLLESSIEEENEAGLYMDLYIKPIYPMPSTNRNIEVDIICFAKNINNLEVGLYNLLGHKILDLNNAGTYNPEMAILKLNFNIPNNVSNGTYFLKVTNGEETRTRGVVIAK